MDRQYSIIDHQFPLLLQKFTNNSKESAAHLSLSHDHNNTHTNNTNKQVSNQDANLLEFITESKESYDGIIDQLDILITSLKIAGLSDDIVNDFIVDTLTSIIKKHYDSKHVQNVFFHYYEYQPKFLSQLLHDKRFRSVVYELSEKYSNCHFLSWMIRWIAEDEQYRAELKAVASDATAQYDVFQKAFLDSLMRIVSLESEQDIASSVMKDFFNLCSHSEYTYIYSQCILRSLSRNSKNERIKSHFRRVSDELERFAISTIKTSDVLLRRLLTMIDENYWLKMENPQNESELNSKLNRFSDVSNSIVNILSGNLTNSDIIKLYNTYLPEGKDWPPIEFLRNADLLEKLLQEIYIQGSNKSKSDRAKYYHLLSIATCDDPTSKENIQPLYKAFVETVEICSNKSSARDLVATIRKLREFTMYNSICIGIIFWIQKVFEDPESFGTTELNNVRIYLSFIEEIAYKHQSLRPAILTLAKNLLCRKQKKDASQTLELQKLFTHIIIFVLRLGHVLEAIYCIRDIAENVDMAIIRYVIQNVLDTVKSPFSLEFRYQFCKILCITRVYSALSNQDKIVSSVRTFVVESLQNSNLRKRFDAEELIILENFT